MQKATCKVHVYNLLDIGWTHYVFPRLDALDPNAYEAFKASRNLRNVVDRVLDLKQNEDKPGLKKELSVRANLMTPIQPMLVGENMVDDISVYTSHMHVKIIFV